MFVQVIRGRTSNPADIREAMDRWAQDLAPGAVGWLGSTGGVTHDDRFIGLSRYQSEEAARRNSDRPEQGAWFTEILKLCGGEVTVKDGRSAEARLVGDPDQARFVQVFVIQDRSSEPDRAVELTRGMMESWREHRPDVLGRVIVQHDDGAWTMAIYFTTEEEARAGWRKEMPPQMQAQLAEFRLSVGAAEYFDLQQPWLYSAR